MQLAKRIRRIREEYNLTQAEIAYRCNISPSAYGQIEKKAINTKFQTLCKIANAIGVTVSFLVDIESNEYSQKNKL